MLNSITIVTGTVNDDRARELDRGSDSGFQQKTRSVYGLRYNGQTIRVTSPEALIGRGVHCEIVITTPLVSRQHAKIKTSEYGASIEDLGSRNGTYVNDVALTEPVILQLGDKITIGDVSLELVEIEDSAQYRAHVTLSDMRPVAPSRPGQYSFSLEDCEESLTRRADAFKLLAGVVDKALAMGRGEEAERVLSGHLTSALRDAKQGAQVAPELCSAASQYAIKLALATGKASWVDYAIELYSVLKRPMPLALVDELYLLPRKVRGVNRSLLKAYIAELKKIGSGLSPTERFTLQRIEGLERLLGL
jgi:pSer/pThr/pTyr-binding forkhead associated (FHA) protein